MRAKRQASEQRREGKEGGVELGKETKATDPPGFPFPGPGVKPRHGWDGYCACVAAPVCQPGILTRLLPRIGKGIQKLFNPFTYHPSFTAPPYLFIHLPEPGVISNVFK